MRKKIIEKSNDKKRNLKRVQDRRNQWRFIAKEIEDHLKNAALTWERETGVNLAVQCRSNTRTDIGGSRTINANYVGLVGGIEPNGVVTKINGHRSEIGIQEYGNLNFSQTLDGKILVTATPSTSKNKDFPIDQIMIYAPKEPRYFYAYNKINRAVYIYLWLINISSYEKMPNYLDRVLLIWFELTKWRNSRTWKDWTMFLVAILTLIFSFISCVSAFIQMIPNNLK